MSSFRLWIGLLAAVLVPILAGCGGQTKGESPQIVSGNGFSAAAPAGWRVKRDARELSASGRGPAMVSIRVFALERSYRPDEFPRVVRELDGVAADLANGLAGDVTASRTVRVRGREARQYDVAYGDRVAQVTFVLDGRREYQLLCRRAADGDRAPCEQLVSSFRLA